MRTHPFRRRNPQWYRWCGAVLCLVVLYCVQTSNQTFVDPHSTVIQSGQYLVVHVVADGEIHLRFEETADGDAKAAKLLRIRLLGIGDLNPAATDELRKLVMHKEAYIRFDRRRLCDGDLLQAYVFVTNRCVNVELVRMGLVRSNTHHADAAPMIRQFERSELEARANQRGIWRWTS